MNQIQKDKKGSRPKSLQARVFRAVLMGSFLLGIVTLLVGIAIYTYTFLESQISSAFGLSITAGSMISKTVDVGSLSDEIMTIYNGLSEEERQMTGTEEYNRLFDYIYDNPEYWKLIEILDTFASNTDVSDVYVGVYDRRTQSLVYICDPDKRQSRACLPGEWEPLEDRELNKFLKWEGKGELYDIGKTDRYGYMCTSGFPLDFEEENSLFVLVDITLDRFLRGLRRFVLSYTVTLILLVILIGWFMNRHMDRLLVQPINRIGEAARKYVKDRKDGYTANDHFASLEIHTGDELENLGNVMAEMEKGLGEYEQDLTRATADRERLTVQLTLAEKIQAEMLPKNFDDFRERNEFALYALMDPAMEVGGDFYDFYMLDDDHLVLTIADVSGKGIPAALFMMASKIKIGDYVRMGLPLAEVMEKTNNDICAQNVEQMFVTVWTGILEISTGILKAVNAGHEYPVLKDPDGKFELFKDKHGFVIGGMEGMKYKEYEIQMRPGSALFLYTDGVPEATSKDNELFGTDRMLEALNKDPDAAPEVLLENVHKAADAFGGEEQFDDLTMLCIRYFGPSQNNEH